MNYKFIANDRKLIDAKGKPKTIPQTSTKGQEGEEDKSLVLKQLLGIVTTATDAKEVTRK